MPSRRGITAWHWSSCHIIAAARDQARYWGCVRRLYLFGLKQSTGGCAGICLLYLDRGTGHDQMGCACYNLVWGEGGMPRWGASILGHAPSKAILPCWEMLPSLHFGLTMPPCMDFLLPWRMSPLSLRGNPKQYAWFARFALENWKGITFGSRNSKQYSPNFTCLRLPNCFRLFDRIRENHSSRYIALDESQRLPRNPWVTCSPCVHW